MSTVNRLQCLEKLGEGTYGVVYKARELATGQIVAFKRMMIGGEEEGVPATAIREVCLLKELRHDNIVRLHDVLFEPPKMTLIFEYCEWDLKKYMELKRHRMPLDIRREVQPILKQMLLGLRFTHRRSVVHRDLKPENVFISLSKTPSPPVSAGGESPCGNGRDSPDAPPGDLVVKLGDFGLARGESIPVKKYSHDVVSLWYRSPDVMMGSALYGSAVDMWSIGCIFAEMVTGKALFSGCTETEQLVRMAQLLGTPNPQTWPSLPTYPKRTQVVDAMAQYARENTHTRTESHAREAERREWHSANVEAFSFPPELQFESGLESYVESSGFRARAGSEGVDLLRGLLRYEPSQRFTAHEALCHPFLQNVAAPVQRQVDAMAAILVQALERHGVNPEEV